jgi:hypothetical protein
MPDAFRLPLAHAAGSSKLVPSPLTRMKQRIFISPPHPSGLEQHFIAEAFRSGWLTGSGPNVTAFETEFAKRMGIEASQAVALVSGTAALHLAMVSCGVGPGDEVLAPTFTFCASVNPVLYMGATPVLLDIEERSWNLDPALLEETLERKARAGRLPKAVVVAHSYGQPADLAPIRQACDRHGVKLVEDAASSLGASYCGQSLGTLGDFGAFSFNGNKVITTTGGGMLVVRDGTAAEHLRSWRPRRAIPPPTTSTASSATTTASATCWPASAARSSVCSTSACVRGKTSSAATSRCSATCRASPSCPGSPGAVRRTGSPASRSIRTWPEPIARPAPGSGGR